MRVHHLNCATQCTLGGCLISGQGSIFDRARLICHCLLIETEAGLVLIDTGLGLNDIAYPQQRLSRPFQFLAQPRLEPMETAIRQIEILGFSSSDVRHIILTHLDLDHAGGLSDFPKATVHLLDQEYLTAVEPPSFSGSINWFHQWQHQYRYRPAQWIHQPDWVRYTPKGEEWFSFDCVQQLQGLPPEILLIPLTGHTNGHAGVAVQTQAGWLLHAGDAYYHRHQMNPVQPVAR